MQLDIPKLDKGQAGLALALLLQTAGVLLWAGGAAARLADLEVRIERQGGVAERLARLEAQSEETRAALVRIEDKLDRRGGGR